MLSNVYLVRIGARNPVIHHWLRRFFRENADQILSQSFKSAEKHVVRISEEVVEAEGVVTDSGAANSAYRLFGNVRNISLAVVNLLRQYLDQSIESIVIDTEIQGVSNGTFETDLAVFGYPGELRVLRHLWATHDNTMRRRSPKGSGSHQEQGDESTLWAEEFVANDSQFHELMERIS